VGKLELLYFQLWEKEKMKAPNSTDISTDDIKIVLVMASICLLLGFLGSNLPA
jgi:hypothetical protein